MHPYECIVDFLDNTDGLIRYTQRSNVRCVLVFISLQFTPSEVENFVQTHIHPNSTIDSYYLLFPDGEDYEHLWSARYGDRLRWCGSVSDDFLTTVLAACYAGCSLRIGYYERLFQQYKYQGVNDLVERANLEIRTLVRLQQEYHEQYLRYLNS